MSGAEDGVSSTAEGSEGKFRRAKTRDQPALLPFPNLHHYCGQRHLSAKSYVVEISKIPVVSERSLMERSIS